MLDAIDTGLFDKSALKKLWELNALPLRIKSSFFKGIEVLGRSNIG